jgi:hypothetical protein
VANGFDAQRFVLSQAATISDIGFDIIQFDPVSPPTSVSWFFLEANGVSGLPGLPVVYGVTAATLRGTQAGVNFTHYDYSLSTGGVSLAAGTYYVAFHEIFDSTMAQTDLIAQGTDASDPFHPITALSLDGGANWATGDMRSVSVFVEGTYATPAPEPISIALLMTGVAGLVLARPRRRHDRTLPTTVQ